MENQNKVYYRGERNSLPHIERAQWPTHHFRPNQIVALPPPQENDNWTPGWRAAVRHIREDYEIVVLEDKHNNFYVADLNELINYNETNPIR